MIIDGAWEKKIFKLWEEKKYDLAKNEVFKFRMRYYDKLERVEDKIFLDYRMAYHEYKGGNRDLANIYFKNLEDIFSDEYVKDSCACSYYKYKWLYINNNESILTKEEIIDGMMEIVNYYSKNKDEKLMKMAYANIFKFKGDEKELLQSLKYVLDSNKYCKINFLNSILKDCEEINHNLYIKALDIINEYKENFIIDVV